MRIGTWSLGRVDPLEGEWITTRFAVFGPLLIPLHSELHGEGRAPVPLPLYPKSVVWGWVRGYLVLAGIAACAVGAGWIARGASDLDTVPLWIAGAVCWAIAGVSRRFGRVAWKDVEPRQVIHNVTGRGVLPEVLGETGAREVLRQLERSWRKHHREWREPEEWREAIEAGPQPESASFLAVLATFERYLEGDTRAFVGRERRAWEHRDMLPPFRGRAKPDRAKPDRAGRTPKKPAKATSSDKAGALSASSKRKGVKVRCPKCEATFRTTPDTLGRQGRCPRCQGVIELPAGAS